MPGPYGVLPPLDEDGEPLEPPPVGQGALERRGMVTTIVGLSVATVGGIMILAVWEELSDPEISIGELVGFFGGSLFAAGGGLTALVGGIVWGAGAAKRRSQQKEWKQRFPDYEPQVSIGPGSVSLSWQFQ